MGGINHQPTKKPFAFSTLLSQYFTGALGKLMYANYELEQALLTEMRGGSPWEVNVYMENAKSELGESLRFLYAALEATTTLHNRMAELEYQDTSRFTVSDFAALGCRLAQIGLIPGNMETWKAVSEMREDEAFYGVCRLITEELNDLVGKTKEVVQSFHEATQYALEGRLMAAVDENLIPFRHAFFRLITSWVKAWTMFIQSAAMSTEMYYREEGYGTLLSVRELAAV